MPRVTPLYYHYSNEPSICDAFDSTHVQYINDTLHIIRSVFKPQLIHNTKYAKYAGFFCCSLYMSAGIVLLPYAPLPLVECYCNMDACWTVATQLACCRPFATQYCHSNCWYGVSLSAVSAGLVFYNKGHACWCSTSLSAMLAGVLLHIRSCILVWYLTISYACWCGASI